jgi:hypothetical protein
MVAPPRRVRRITWWVTAPWFGRSDRPGCLPPIPTGPAGQAQRSGLPDGRTDCVRCGGAFRHEHSSVTRPSVCASEASMCDGLPVDAPSPFSAP